MNKYVTYYRGHKAIHHANTTYEAQQKAAKEFKARKTYEVTVYLVEKDGKEVVHTADF